MKIKYPLILCIAILSPILCPAYIILDEAMNKETQRETGIAKLSTKQKQAIEKWLNANFEIKKNKEEAITSLSVSFNLHSGKQLKLSDGSLWDIAPDDTDQAAVWLSPVPIQIMLGNNPDYPYLLVNMLSGISIKARRNASTELPVPSSTNPEPSTQK